jgi:hypothetical protein
MQIEMPAWSKGVLKCQEREGTRYANRKAIANRRRGAPELPVSEPTADPIPEPIVPEPEAEPERATRSVNIPDCIFLRLAQAYCRMPQFRRRMKESTREYIATWSVRVTSVS